MSRVKELRKKQRLTVAELSKLSGVPIRTLSRIEATGSVTTAKAAQLAPALNTSAAYLLHLTDNPLPDKENSVSSKDKTQEELELQEGKIVYEHIVDNHGFQETTRLYFPNGTPPAYMSEVVREVKATLVEKSEQTEAEPDSMPGFAVVGGNSV